MLQHLGQAEQKLAEADATSSGGARRASTVLLAPATGVVTPAQTRTVIVPDRRPLVAEAMVANRDTGFVHAGEAVDVKWRHSRSRASGLCPDACCRSAVTLWTRCRWIRKTSNCATKRRTPRRERCRISPGARAAATSPGSVSIATDAERRHAVQPGMSVTAEIRIGARRVTSYLS